MDIDVRAYNPAELRAYANFINALADIREKQPMRGIDAFFVGGGSPEELTPTTADAAGQSTTADPAPAVVAQATIGTKGRKKKEPDAPAATEPATAAGSSTLDKVIEQGQADAAADAAAASTATAPDPTTKKEDGPTHDDIRKVIGELSQKGKRNEAVAIVRNRPNKDGNPCNGVSEIQEKHLQEIYDALLKLKA